VTKVLKDILRPHQCFIDIGANLGYFTMLAASIVGWDGQVYAFDPNPQNVMIIEKSMEANKFDNVTVFNYAVSDKRQTLKFLTVGSNGGVIRADKASGNLLDVKAIALDGFFGNDEPVDVIKMDIEAHEPFALRGMKHLVKQWKPIIVTEFHPWALRENNLEPPEQFLADLHHMGYSMSVIPFEGDIVPNLGPVGVMNYWEEQEKICPTIHTDLLCYPVDI
jgi:FkbM family methyltransferase